MKIPPGQMHPEYQFHQYVKEMKYQMLLRAIGKAKYALTFPGLSNFALERLLIAKYPGIEIHCFEAHKETFNKIVNDFEDVPKEVQVINMSAEQWLADTSCKYDLIFLDYCSGPKDDINALIRSRLADDGIFATTLYHARGTDYAINPTGLSLAIEPLHYDHMYFMGFRNSPQKDTVVSGKLMQSVKRHDKNKMRGIQLLGKKFWVTVMAKGVTKRASAPTLEEAVAIRDQFKYGHTGKTMLVEPKVFKEKEVNPEVVEGRLVGGLTYAQIQPYISRLPEYEQRLVDLYLVKGACQKTIAKKVSLTQGAISSRLRVVAKRIEYLKYVEKFDDADIRRRLSKDFGAVEVDIMLGMKETTCQSEVVKRLAPKYSNLDLTQVKVRYRFLKTLESLVSRAEKQPEKYQDMVDLFTYVRDNLYMAHEVVLPHFSNHTLTEEVSHKGKDLALRVYGSNCVITPELKDKLARAIPELYPKSAQVVDLRYGQGLTNNEVGNTLNIPCVEVNSRLKEAVKSLRGLIRRMEPGFIDGRTLRLRQLSLERT